MPKGKPWTVAEERKLDDLRTENFKVSEIAVVMGKSEQAIMKKLQRMGLKVIQQTSSKNTASELILPKELPSVEESLMMLAGAMDALRTPGLSKTEVTRLRSLVQAASMYQVKLAEYVDYRGIGKKVIQLERKYAEMLERERPLKQGFAQPSQNSSASPTPTNDTQAQANQQ